MYLINNKTYISQSFPSLRGNVNEVDKGESKDIKMNNKTSNIGTPPSAKTDTSPQSREGLYSSQSFPSLRGNVNEVDKGELRNYHSKNYTQKAFNNAKQLRKKGNTTEAEKLLWYYIKNKQLNNYKFRRQVAIGNYIVDFLCPEKKIIIELDGGQHNEDKNIKYDEDRTKYLNNSGYKVLRFLDNDIFKNMNDVLQTIYNELNQSFPSLRRNVNTVDKGELKNIKMNKNNNINTPPSLRDTSPQSREGLFQSIQSSPSLRGRCPQDRGGANNKIGNNISTPPPLRDTSPQGREGLTTNKGN